MTQDNNIDTFDAEDESSVASEDSPVLKALRKQVRDLEKQLKSTPDRATVEAEVREELARTNAISEQLVALGHPKGISAFVANQLGDAEVSRDTVAEALRGIGYDVTDESAAAPSQDESQDQSGSDLAKVTSLSRQVASAAANELPDTVNDRLQEANSLEEINEIMSEAGLTKSYS